MYLDADHAGNSTQKSTTGFVIRLFETPVAWRSHLQQSIAEHTCEAEFIALNEAAHDDLGIPGTPNKRKPRLEGFPYHSVQGQIRSNATSLYKCRQGKAKTYRDWIFEDQRICCPEVIQS